MKFYLGIQESGFDLPDEEEDTSPTSPGALGDMCHPLCQCQKCLSIQKVLMFCFVCGEYCVTGCVSISRTSVQMVLASWFCPWGYVPPTVSVSLVSLHTEGADVLYFGNIVLLEVSATNRASLQKVLAFLLCPWGDMCHPLCHCQKCLSIH